MWIINILAFFIITLFVAYKMKESMVEVFPVTACGLILLLYPLAYIRCLSWIDGISVAILVYSFLDLWKKNKEQRKKYFDEIQDILRQPATWIIVASSVIVSLCVQDRIALWWDDVNFWATDVKSIYYIDGFAGKYGNVAPEFGDYPPGVQLFKWWFLHFSPLQFNEGLMFAGYYTLNMLLLAPLFSGVRKGKNAVSNVIYFVAGSVSLFLFPSVVETFYLEGTCSDLPMAIAYGVFLWGVLDEKNHKPVFSYVRQTFSLALVMICKNTGFQWVVYGLIFWLIYHVIIEKEQKLLLRFAEVSVLPLVMEGSWLLSCVLKRRVAKLTGAGIKMAVSLDVPTVDYRAELLENFIKGFTIEPIHRQNTIGLDLSVAAVLVIAAIILYVFGRKGICLPKQAKLLLWYFGITAVISYGITLVAHMTIFVTELQYLEAVVMTASIERYGAPFTIGVLYVLWQLWVHGKEKNRKSRYFMAISCVCLCAQWPGAYHALIGYRGELADQHQERAAMVEEEARIFKEKTQDIWEDKGTRVLYLRDGSKNHRVKDTYINYEVSPLGVVYGDTTEQLEQYDYGKQLIEQSHASYLYSDSTEIDSKTLFPGMTEEFEYETLYRIEDWENGFRLVKTEKE